MHVNADTGLVTFVMEVLESLPGIFAPFEADEAIATACLLRFTVCIFTLSRVSLSLKDLAAYNLAEKLKITLKQKNSGQ